MTSSSTFFWIEKFQGLSKLETATKEVLIKHGNIITIPEKTTIFGPARSPENILFLIEGVVRVQQIAENGKEIILYRIYAGESCIMTTACLISFDTHSAEGIAETTVKAIAIPRDVFDDLVAQSKSFRNFVFTAFSKRITDLFLMINELAFQRVDVRLAQKLLQLSNQQAKVNTTHQKLASELGSAREVISRQLQEFQRQGWIEQSRGIISLLDKDKLQDLSEKTE